MKAHGPCPAGSHYVAFWKPMDGYQQASGNPGGGLPPPQAGVVYYHGWIEIATCGASIGLHT
jgi:hypothetical protein